jgi:uncharacterized protein YbjT (DUF2867 family)
MGRGRVLVAGASGALGREVVRALAARGWRVRALSREPARLAGLPVAEVARGDALSGAGLAEACDGVERVFSCLGASVSPSAPGRRSFLAVDVPANARLIEAARRAGARRFTYVSAFGAPARRDLAYLRAHEEVVDLLRGSGLSFGVVRPTGFFSAFAEYVQLAARGAVPLVGDGSARTNPVHEADLAGVCAEVLEADGPVERDAGGPEVLTRADIVALAFAAVGRPVRVRRLPAPVARGAALLLRPFHPRLSELTAFVAAVGTSDAVAPATGSLRLAGYFQAHARGLGVAPGPAAPGPARLT